MTQDKTAALKHATENAEGWMKSIIEMVDKLEFAQREMEKLSNEDSFSDASNKIEDAREEIEQSILVLEVRSGWQSVSATLKPAEFNILLSTGGPALRIIGDLDEYLQPENPILEMQDWFTPWTEYHINTKEREYLQKFVQNFYFGY